MLQITADFLSLNIKYCLEIKIEYIFYQTKLHIKHTTLRFN